MLWLVILFSLISKAIPSASLWSQHTHRTFLGWFHACSPCPPQASWLKPTQPLREGAGGLPQSCPPSTQGCYFVHISTKSFHKTTQPTLITLLSKCTSTCPASPNLPGLQQSSVAPPKWPEYKMASRVRHRLLHQDNTKQRQDVPGQPCQDISPPQPHSICSSQYNTKDRAATKVI